jgi:hypothetical protein
MTMTAEDFAGYLTRYPQEVAFTGDDPAGVFDRYHAPGFELWNDGVRLDRDRLLAHVRPARRRAAAVDVDVQQVVVYGDHAAARYTLTATMRSGAVIATEITTVARLAADGRLSRMDQLTRVVDHTLVATSMQQQ